MTRIETRNRFNRIMQKLSLLCFINCHLIWLRGIENQKKKGKKITATGSYLIPRWPEVASDTSVEIL